MFAIGIDLAWADQMSKTPNESGVVMLDPQGDVVYADWTVGVERTVSWLEQHAPCDSLLFVDAPLVVNNQNGQRLCEKQVGQRYGSWKVSANSTNLSSPHLAGVELLRQLKEYGWSYTDGTDGPPSRKGRFVAECYPYTTIVGAPELGYETERPCYKRKPKHLPTEQFRHRRAEVCDELIRRVAGLAKTEPPVDLYGHSNTRRLVLEKSPVDDKAYKHREDLLDAVLCAWTAALWLRYGFARCQVLGLGETPQPSAPLATIIAPARSSQRP